MDYKIYTTEFDEVVRPLDLSSPEELASLAESFHTICPVDDFEPLRERLDKMVVPSEKTVVTLLVDNSGSMRGRRIIFAVGVVGIISMYLDRMGIPNEILGFTTKAWKGGDAREKWISEGKPDNPGRLNVLRHIVYKEFDEQLSDVRNNLALMLREGLLKENIDGEALEWAAGRLRQQDAKRRILLVISDGEPVDQSTTERNSGRKDNKGHTVYEPMNTTFSYLINHLSQVVNQIDQDGDIYLDAIGIGHDVSRFYQVGDKIDELEDLAPTAIGKLEAMLS
jgi:cobaltochelatase CobT